MRIRQVNDVVIPDEMLVNVYAWRFPPDTGDEPSKDLFGVIERIDEKKPDTGLGVWRGHEANPVTLEIVSWMVHVVDVNVDVLRLIPDRFDPFRGAPDPEEAIKLFLRHLSTVTGRAGSQRAHYGLGAVLDAHGNMHVRAGQG